MTETSIEPLSDADLAERKFGSLLESFERLGDDETLFPRILAHAPGYAEALWGAMAEALFNGGVDHSLKEMVRIQLATKAGDPYFSTLRSKQAIAEGLTEERIQAALGDFENDDQFSPAEKWALIYSYRMYRTPETVDTEFYDAGKEVLSEAQIMELGGLIAIHYGLQVFMSTLVQQAPSA